MASTQTPGYHLVALPGWSDLLQSLAARIESFEANYPQQAGHGIGAKSRADLIRHYILDLEYCLKKANRAIGYYETLVQNYDRLVAVMEESRNQAYDTIARLKSEISAAKRNRPMDDRDYGLAPRTDKGESGE